MAASSVLTVNYRGEALFVNVFVPNRESCLRQNEKVIFICVKKNCEYLLSVFFKRKKRAHDGFLSGVKGFNAAYASILVCVLS